MVLLYLYVWIKFNNSSNSILCFFFTILLQLQSVYASLEAQLHVWIDALSSDLQESQILILTSIFILALCILVNHVTFHCMSNLIYWLLICLNKKHEIHIRFFFFLMLHSTNRLYLDITTNVTNYFNGHSYILSNDTHCYTKRSRCASVWYFCYWRISQHT